MTTLDTLTQSLHERPLPDGWRWVRLKEMGLFEAGGTPAKERADYWNGDIPFVTGADITDINITRAHARAFLTKVGLYSGKTAICEVGTLLIVTRTRVGRAGIARELMGVSQDITAFRCCPQMNAEFLCQYLHRISKQLVDNCRGATIQGLTRDYVDNLVIPLPPLAEQKRIAAVLREQMAAVDKARAAAQARLEAVQALPAAFLRQVFPQPGQPLPDGWRWVRLKEMGLFEAGGTPAKERADYWNGDIPFVTGADITDINITRAHARAFLTKVGLYSGKTAICEVGTLLIVTRTRVGRAGIARELMGVSQDITAFRCCPQMNAEFLCQYLHRISKQLVDNCRGATIQGLTRDYVDNLVIPLPPLAEQKRIAAVLREQMACVEQARAVAEAELEAINALPAALLRRAFSGEI